MPRKRARPFANRLTSKVRRIQRALNQTGCKLPSLMNRSIVLTLTRRMAAAFLLVSIFSRMPPRMRSWRIAPKKTASLETSDFSWPSFVATNGKSRLNLSRRFLDVSSISTECGSDFERVAVSRRGVHSGRLELPWVTPHAPQACASAISPRVQGSQE